MSSYSIPHGSTRDFSSSTCSSIQTNREMQQLCGVAEYSYSPECKIFWRTVSKVPNTEDAIKFLLDTKQFIYTVNMFRDTLQLLMKTPENPFVTLANIHTIEAFMNRVGYQGVVDKVSAFFTKNLAQPWQTMFKVFNHCLTTRTFSQDQTKINILQLFHAVINRMHVDYAALLWWDFMNNMFQNKEAIQYPRFTKLIIADLMKKFPNIPKRIEDDYHSIKDDVPLVTEIRKTNDFKEYETVFMKTKKRKQTAGVFSSIRKIIKQKKQSTPSIPPPGDDRERDEIAEATLLSLTLHKTTLLVEAQENIAKVQEKLDEEEIDKMVEGSYTRYERKGNYTRLEIELCKYNQIPSPIRSPRNVSFSEKTTAEDLTDNISPTTATTFKTSFTPKQKKRSFTLKTRNLPGSIVGMGRRRNLIRSHIKNKFITRVFFMEKIQEVLQHCNKIVPELAVTKTNEMLKKRCLAW
ncbi:hypothetical protein Tco_0728131 [Tanacetum coccineum]|uniref:Uncharacterized protein n=1 Tax=Tanacetum coccineum TaxID=301880 RepID=A0ABQ4YMM2_9ASTR